MGEHDFANDGQAESAPQRIAFFQPEEAQKYVLPLRLGNARPIVAHCHDHAIGQVRHRHGDQAALRRIAQGIVDQVGNHFAEQDSLPADHGRQRVAPFVAKIDPLANGERQEFDHRIARHGGREGHETFRALAGAVDWARFPLLVVGGLTAANLPLTRLPGWLVNTGQLLLGSALGTRFSPSFFRAAPRFLSISAGATTLTLLLCAAFVGALGWLIPIPFASLLLASSPGGMAEMSITAREMHLSVPLVTATHVLRVVLLTACAPLLCQRYLAWRNATKTTPGDKP